MKKIASGLVFLLFIFISLAGITLGAIFYQEGVNEGIGIALISATIFLLLLITPKEN
jgi:hypothetical protein